MSEYDDLLNTVFQVSRIITASLSLIASTLNAVLIIKYPKLHTFICRIIFLLAATNILMSLTSLIDAIRVFRDDQQVDDGLCVTTAFLSTWTL